MVSIVCLLCAVNPISCQDPRAKALAETCVAIATVESHMDPNAIGDGGLAVGILQIQPIMVRDCNRILGRRKYTLADRYDVCKSAEMFVVHSLHYWPDGGPEQWARGWNGGAPGPRRKCTLRYWQKIRAAMKGK